MRFPRIGGWTEVETGQSLLTNIHAAKVFWQRLLGLQFASSLPDDTGVLLKDCRSIHTFWMRFPIDVIFLDEDYCVVETHEAVRPWRIAVPKAKTVRHVLESNPGVSRKLRIGIRTRIE